MMLGLLTQLGSVTLTRLAVLGRAAFFVARVLGLVVVPPLKGRLIVQQMHFIGARSVLVIALTGAFAGMVLGLQGFHVLTRFGSEALLGQFVSLTLITELGPVFSAIMVTARAGSAITAQIGIMRITEQLDAMTVMALNPLRYVAVPNVVAGTLVMPLLGAMFSVIGIFGGYVAGVLILGVNRGTYFGGIEDVVDLQDVTNGMYKSLCFGLVVLLVCCFKGYHAGYGAEGVSKATTEAVVISAVLVLVLDYFLNTVLL